MMNKNKPGVVEPFNQNIPTGTAGKDCQLRLNLFTPTLLALNIEGTSERTATPLLTLEAALALREQLDELIPQLQSSTIHAEDESVKSAA